MRNTSRITSLEGAVKLWEEKAHGLTDRLTELINDEAVCGAAPGFAGSAKFLDRHTVSAICFIMAHILK